MTNSTKKIVFTLGLTILSYPLWRWLIPYIVKAEDYVPQGEKGVEMVESLGTLFVLTILMCITFVASITLAQHIFKK